jgi:tetratricopeptide (TPR) repeat protein
VEFTNGQRALEKGSLDSAIGWLGSAIQREPNNAVAYRLMAKARYLKAESMGEPQGLGAERAVDTPASLFNRAIEDATKAIELDPKDAEAFLIRAQAQHRKGGDEAKSGALADCKKVLELAPDGPVAEEAKKLRDQIGG